MEIKPIRRVQRVEQSEIGKAKIDRNSTSQPVSETSSTTSSLKFQSGRLYVRGREIGELIQKSLNEPTAFWSTLAQELEAFRDESFKKFARKRKKKAGDKLVDEELDPNGELGQISAIVDAYIAKIMRVLKRKYDEKADGLSYSLDEDGQLILNGVNVTSFLITAKKYPSQKARLFLQGLKNRLGLMLSSKQGSSNYDKVRDKTLQVISEIDQEIHRILEKDRLLE